MGRKTKVVVETEIGKGIGIGIGTEVEAEIDLVTEVVIEGLDIVVGMREDEDLNVYSAWYTSIHLVLLILLYCLAGGTTFFNQLAQSVISCISVECPKSGYERKKVPGSPDSLASFTPTFLSSSLDSFPSDSGTKLSSSPWPQKMGMEVSGDLRSYQRHVKPLNHKSEATHAYLFNLLPDGEPATENSEAGELVRGCESSDQCHGPPLTESTEYNPIRRGTPRDLLLNELGYLILGPEDPSFVFRTFEPKTKDIEPATAN